ncbi:CRACD-like protein isoform X2 [Oncorhynchus mykiss]|uniref:Si:ch211-121j5.4 n=1 Tax=Oncorhynchus mykiss TaxID=8022 RepID=A0A8C7NFS5_ONCMY|nr:CRACD-like protein isoform X2 [Oncorhynchus mykiss]XP_036830994.1 CRACD-like protein isoform X2 [Oncorhynchus mykiss]
MESFPGDGEGSLDDLTGGKRKSKLKTLKIRLFGRTKRETKFSQSASDVTEAEGLGSAENLCSGVLGSRALSHDSIFLPDQDLSSPEQPRVLSQENVQGRIKELQMKLLQQNMHLGPPPLVLPMKHPEDLGGSSEDDGLPHSPPEISIGNNMAPRGLSYKFPAPPRHHISLSLAGTGSEKEVQACSQPSSRPLSPVPKPRLTNSVPHTPSAPQTAFSPAPPALDFITPAQFTPCLDNSAARHRMSIKPRNQRASAKNKRLNMTESRPRSESLNNFDQQLTEDEEGPAITGGRTRLRCHSTLILKSQQGGSTTSTAPPELTPLKSSSTEAEGSPKKPTLPCKLSPQEQPYPGVPVVSPAPVTRQLPGAKQPQPSSVTTVQDLRYTPQQQTLKQSLGAPKPPDPSQTKRDVLSKSGVPNSTPSTEGSPKDEPLLSARPTASLTAVVTLRTSSLRSKTDARAGGQSTTQPPAGQEDTGQAEPMSTGGAPKPGSGPFLFSINSAKGRETPRMGSGGFLVVVEQAGDGAKREDGTEVKLNPSNASQREQEQQRGRRERDKPKEEELTAIDMGGKVSEGVEVEEESGEGVEDAVEAKEETEVDGKIAFGVNLRSISLSPRVEAEATTSQSDLKIKRHSAEVGALLLAPYTPSSKPTGLEGLRDTPPTRANSMPKKLYTNNWVSPTTLSSSRGRAGSLREADTATPAQPTPSPLIKEAQTTPARPKEDQTLPVLPIEAQATTSAPQNPLTAPHAAPQAAVSWMSMAWGKTRGLQQLFTSSLPREFTGMQSPTQPQAQTTTQPQSQTTMQPLTAKLLESQNAVKPPQTAAQAPTQTTKLPVTQTTTPPQAQTTKLPVTQTTKHLQTTKTPRTQNGTQPQTMTQQSTQNSKPSTQTSNQINTRAAQPTATQPLAQSTQCAVSQVTPQSSRRANQPTLCSTPQTQAQITLRIAPMGATSTQPPWSALNLNPIPQPKPALAPTATPVQLLVRGEKIPGDQRNSEGAAVSTEKRVDRDRPSTVGGTAAFLEKRAEWTPPAGSKVELRRTKTPPESQPTAELAAPPKATPSHRDAKDVKLDRRPESSPTIVAGRLADREDKWLRKNMPTSLSPSSSPSSSSPLQTISDSGGQPSWMELAKRKSMAWNDKTMD